MTLPEILDKLRKRYGLMVWDHWNRLTLAEKILAVCASLESRALGLEFRLSLYSSI